MQRAWREWSLSVLLTQTWWDLFGHWLLRAMEYQWVNTHFLTYACTQGPSLVENGTAAAMRPWGQTKLPFLAKVHICDAHMNTKTHISTDSMWWPFLTHFAFQLRALLWTLENHLFFLSRVTLIDKLAKPRGRTQTNSESTQQTHAYIYITTACLNFRTQWKYYCSVTLLKWCLCVRPKLAFEYANASAGSNLERRGALMWSTSSLNQAAMLTVTQLHWSHSLYATANTHAFSDTATFPQILIQTCQTDNSHHGTIWLNELKWMRNEMKNREGKKNEPFVLGFPCERFRWWSTFTHLWEYGCVCCYCIKSTHLEWDNSDAKQALMTVILSPL